MQAFCLRCSGLEVRWTNRLQARVTGRSVATTLREQERSVAKLFDEFGFGFRFHHRRANRIIFGQSRKRSDADEIILNHLLRHADDENKMNRFAGVFEADAFFAATDAEHDFLHQISARVRKCDAMLRQG